MNRTDCVRGLVLLFVTLVAGWSVHAHGTHPVSDNMCGAHDYGDCFNDGDWIRGYYDKLRHSEPRQTDPRQAGWDYMPGVSGGLGYSGQPRVPEDNEISSPQTTGSSDQTCHVQHVRISSVNYQRCVSETKFWCDQLADHTGTAREYVQWIMPSHISC